MKLLPISRISPIKTEVLTLNLNVFLFVLKQTNKQIPPPPPPKNKPKKAQQLDYYPHLDINFVAQM